jgi:ketosteroid isomerase-like protein
VLAANRAFYEAFEGSDLDAMSDLWEHGDHVVCTHPGWGSLRGWGAVSASFLSMFQASHGLQFILTDVAAEVDGDVAWVSLDENILNEEVGGTASTINLFRRRSGRWRLVAHHASPIAVDEG